MTAAYTPKRPPQELVVYVCDGCGRKALSSLDLRSSHFHRGKRCPGQRQEVKYWIAPAA